MNISKVGGAVAAERSFQPRSASGAQNKESFVVPDEAPETPEAAPEAQHLEGEAASTPLDLLAWMISLPAPAPTEQPARPDLTHPAVTLAPPSKPEPGEAARAAAPPASPEGSPLRRDGSSAEAPSVPEDAPALEGAISPARAAASPHTPASSASAAHAAESPPEARSRAKDAPAPSRADASPLDAAPLAAASAGGPAAPPWVTPSAEAPRGDGPLTTVSELTTASPSEEAAASRARLHDALASSVHQRTLRDVAHGELTLPELGHVAVRAHADHGAVDVEIRAAQAATAQALHAQAESLAADIRAADVTVTRLSFEGAGAWVPSQDVPQHGREQASGHRPRGEASTADSVRPAPSAGARVRIVL